MLRGQGDKCGPKKVPSIPVFWGLPWGSLKEPPSKAERSKRPPTSGLGNQINSPDTALWKIRAGWWEGLRPGNGKKG